MSNVVKFDPNANKPHSEGPMKCARCGHEWIQVCKFEDRLLAHECPECKLEAGHYHGFGPEVGSLCFTSDCGCEFFYVTPEGVMCIGCGVLTAFSDLVDD